jgi:hypothetical protein
MKRRPAGGKIIAVFLDTLMAILHSLNHRRRSVCYESRYLTNTVGLQDVAMMAALSA